MLHLMRQALADTAAASQDDRPAAGGDVDMVDQCAAAPDPEVPTGVSLSKAQNESLAKMAGERKRQLLQMKTADEMDKMPNPQHPIGGVHAFNVITAVVSFQDFTLVLLHSPPEMPSVGDQLQLALCRISVGEVHPDVAPVHDFVSGHSNHHAGFILDDEMQRKVVRHDFLPP